MISSVEVSSSPKLFHRLHLWFAERFPAANVFTGFLIYYVTAAVASKLNGGEFSAMAAENIFGGFAMAAFLLQLRVFDEHKDFAADMVHHPDRVLQRNLINLDQLKVIGWLSFSFQLIFVILMGAGNISFLSFAMMTLWSVLMANDFFSHDFLKKHLFLLVASHMIVISFSVLWIWTCVTQTWPTDLTAVFLIALPFFTGLIYEITRKSKGQEEEIENLMTYSKLFSGRKLMLAVFAISSVAIVLSALVFYSLIQSSLTFPKLIFPVAVLLSLLILGLGWRNYLRLPNMKNRKRNEALSGLGVLIWYSLILFAAFSN